MSGFEWTHLFPDAWRENPFFFSQILPLCFAVQWFIIFCGNCGWGAPQYPPHQSLITPWMPRQSLAMGTTQRSSANLAAKPEPRHIIVAMPEFAQEIYLRGAICTKVHRQGWPLLHDPGLPRLHYVGPPLLHIGFCSFLLACLLFWSLVMVPVCHMINCSVMCFPWFKYCVILIGWFSHALLQFCFLVFVHCVKVFLV